MVDVKIHNDRCFQFRKKSDCTVTVADSDLLGLMTRKTNPQPATFQGKLKIDGSLGLQ